MQPVLTHTHACVRVRTGCNGQAAYRVDDVTYYGLEQLPDRLHICLASYPQEKPLSLLITTRQEFDNRPSGVRTITSERYPDFKLELSVNQNLTDFYSTYPTSFIGDEIMTRWAMYANTPIDENIRRDAYPQLESLLQGLSRQDALNRLLNWVQTGLEYEYDNVVWGEDRAFFAEESLYYPYCDCEDRSILFTRLVRDLLGLKCLLVYYPGHLASAVAINDVPGDYIEVGGQRYVIADGTYIGAELGRTMRGMDNQSARVIVLD